MKQITTICLTLSIFLSACNFSDEIPDQSKSPTTTPSLIFNHVITNHVIMSLGVDYNTQQTVALNPLTGQIIEPCNQHTPDTSYSKTPDQNTNPDCNVEIVDDQPKIQNALTLAEETAAIPTKVRKADGSIVDATAIVSLTVLYPGSHCQTYYSGGQKTTNCSSSDKNYCKLIEPARSIATPADKTKCAHYWPPL